MLSVCEQFDFSIAAVPAPRKARAELMKDIDADYYGYRDEDDGVLAPLEQEYEKQGGQIQPDASVLGLKLVM